MKIDDAVETIAKFFNDLIGALVPGMVLVACISTAHLGPEKTMTLLKAMDNTPVLLMLLAVMFALGHALSAIFETVISKNLRALHLTKGFNEQTEKRRESYVRFLQVVEKDALAAQNHGQASSDWNYHDLRSVALSVSQEAASIGRRFMFISLLCNGVGTAITITAIDFAACLVFQRGLLHPYPMAVHWAVQIALLGLAAYTLFQRGEVFYRRAMTTPFSVALAEKRLKAH